MKRLNFSPSLAFCPYVGKASSTSRQISAAKTGRACPGRRVRVLPRFFVGSPRTVRSNLQFTVKVLIKVTYKVMQRWSQSVRVPSGALPE